MPEMTIRDTQVLQGQNNPNIISPMVGGSTGGQMQAPPAPKMFGQGPTPAITQAYEQIAKPMSQQLYGGQFLPGVQNQGDAATRMLYQADKALEAKYQGASSFPTPQWYVPNPAEEMRGVANFGTGMANVSQDLTKVASGTEQAYQTAISAVLDKFVSFLQMKEQRERDKEDREYKERIQREEWAREDAKAAADRKAQSDLLASMGFTIDEQGNIIPKTATTTTPPATIGATSPVDEDEWEVVPETPSATLNATPTSSLGKLLNPTTIKETALNTAATLGGPVASALNWIRQIAGKGYAANTQ